MFKSLYHGIKNSIVFQELQAGRRRELELDGLQYSARSKNEANPKEFGWHRREDEGAPPTKQERGHGVSSQLSLQKKLGKKIHPFGRICTVSLH